MVTRDQPPTWAAFGRELGHELRRVREERGLSQAVVAGRAGIAPNTYQRLESGLSRPGTPMNPRLDTLVALCRALDLSPTELLGGPLPDPTRPGGRPPRRARRAGESTGARPTADRV